MEIRNNASPNTPKLKDEEILGAFMEYLVPTCIDIKPGENLIVYRTQDIIPVDDYGQAPRPRRKFGENAINRKLSNEEVQALSPKKREKILGDWGLSCNDSEEAARQSFLYTYKSLKQKGATQEELEAYVHDRGQYICRFILTNEVGLVTAADEHEHRNIYLYEGVNLENFRDKEYNYTTIDYQQNED